jgi:hypothetical protein
MTFDGHSPSFPMAVEGHCSILPSFSMAVEDHCSIPPSFSTAIENEGGMEQ